MLPTLWYFGGTSGREVNATTTANITPSKATKTAKENLPPSIIKPPRIIRKVRDMIKKGERYDKER